MIYVYWYLPQKRHISFLEKHIYFVLHIIYHMFMFCRLVLIGVCWLIYAVFSVWREFSASSQWISREKHVCAVFLCISICSFVYQYLTDRKSRCLRRVPTTTGASSIATNKVNTRVLCRVFAFYISRNPGQIKLIYISIISFVPRWLLCHWMPYISPFQVDSNQWNLIAKIV